VIDERCDIVRRVLKREFTFNPSSVAVPLFFNGNYLSRIGQHAKNAAPV
jgi:hypothetical protein